ncbi:MAG: signal recognition particle-docking protein FtsY [archaeon]
MFKFLKEKLSKAVSIFSKKVEEEAEIKQEEKEIKQPEKAEPAEKKIDAERKTEAKIERKPEKEHLFKDDFEEKREPEKRRKEEEEKNREEERAAAKKEKEGREEREDKEKLAREEAESREKKEVEERRAAAELKKEEEKKAHEKKSFLQRLFHHEKKEEKKESEKEAEIEKSEEIKEEGGKEAEEEEIKEPEEEKNEEPAEAIEPELTKPAIQKEEEKKGFFAKIKETLTTVKLSDEKFEKLFWELELAMLENNVAVEVIEKIKEDLRIALTTGKVSRKGIDELIHDSLKESIESLFIDNDFDLINAVKAKKEKPFIISFIGVNGSGKTTTMAKLANLLIKNNLSVVFAASDTFRAAAIQQLQEHADKLGIKMIKHDYESDPAAVAFDAVKHAHAKGIDVVLIDTAGRLHSNDNLMNELKKLMRVNKPDLKVFVGESITGNDCVEQAKLFNEAVGIDVIILAKADVDEKGGAAISVSFVTKKPIIYLGTGQRYEDLTEFRPEIIMQNIGL